MAQFATPEPVKSCWESRARPLLDLHLHQLAAHVAAFSCMGRAEYRQRLVVIGVQTPEFAFEQNLDNVRRAVCQMRIEYPVVIDNDYAIWRAFNNHYLPGVYFFDARGRVRQHHFGEGEYQRTEPAIHACSPKRRRRPSRWMSSRVAADRRRSPRRLGQPEVAGNYIGYARTENSASPGGATRSPSRLRGARATDTQSMGPGGRMDDRESGRSSAVLVGGWSTAFMRATFISSWGRRQAGAPRTFPRHD